MIAVGYLRVSTAGQRDEGVSLAAQLAAIRAWGAARPDVNLTVFEETESGARASNRPYLEDALALACRVRGVLVVYSLSRLARSTKDALEIADRLSKCRANLVSLSESIDTTTPGGQFVFTVFAAVAQLERDQISERTRAALQYKKSQGQRVSRFAPYGFEFDGKGRVIANEREQIIIATILEWHREGLRSPAIADLLDTSDARYDTRTGNPWRASSVRRIIACHGS